MARVFARSTGGGYAPLLFAGFDLCTGAAEAVDFDESEAVDFDESEAVDFDESEPAPFDEPEPDSFDDDDSPDPFAAGAVAPTPAAAFSLLSVR
jgi:hypothetical protein